jgi:type VI secretion system secreted protein Hcp
MEYMLLEMQDKVKINGETTLKGFDNMVEVLSYSHGVAQQVLGTTSHTGRTTGRPNFQDMTISKTLDATTPLLNYNCAKAANLGTVKLHLVRQDASVEEDYANASAYMVYEMGATVISSVSVGGGGGGLPVETITLNFSNISWTYKPQKLALGENGNIVGSWDQATNSGESEGEFAAESGEAAA